MADTAFSHRPATALSGPWQKLRLIMTRRAAYHATMRDLGRLSDHGLRDIGLTRSDIRRVAREARDQVA